MKIQLYISICIMLLLTACKPSLPDGILDEDTMAEVLYDIHIAHFIPKQPGEPGSDAEIQIARQMQILDKHGITQGQWDASMKYYSRHADLLKSIYSTIYENMSYKAMAMGVSFGGMEQMGDDIEVDTTDIWSSSDHFMLLSVPPYTSQTWDITPNDSVLKTGERLTFRFFARYMNQTAPMQCNALIAITLDNDSVIQSTSMVGSFGSNTLTVNAPENRMIKKIRGMFIMGRTNDTSPMAANQTQATSKLPQALLITRPHLLHSTPIVQVKDTLDKSPKNVYVNHSSDSMAARHKQLMEKRLQE